MATSLNTLLTFYSWRDAFVPATWSTWALVVIGGIASYVSIKTLKTLVRQTEAATQAAHTGELNAQAIVNSERAWIIVQMASEHSPEGMLSLENQGRTPADITSIVIRRSTLLPGDDLPSSPDYGTLSEYVHRTVVGPGRVWNCEVISVPSGATFSDIFANKRLFYVYGIVKYQDVLSGHEHETRFCFSFNPDVYGFIVAGPPSYTRYT